MSRGEGIKAIGNLFEKYKQQLIAPQGSVISAFQEVVEDILTIEVPKEHVSYNTHTKVLSLQTKGPIKTEIKLRKKEILAHLKGRLGEKNAPKEII